ncbi:MAG: S9 family peptidase [Gemmatimonadaceae bacterium]
MRSILRYALAALVAPALLSAQAQRAPTVDDLLNLRTAGAAQLSPDGKRVAYTVSQADWTADNFVSQVYLVSADGGEPVQLTRGDKSSGQVRWSPDGQWISFASSRVDNKSQVFVIRPDGGEALQLTKAENGVQAYDWSRDGRTIAFTAIEPSVAMKDRKASYGDFEVVRRDYQHSHLFTFDVASAMQSQATGRQRTRGADYTVNGFDWSPDGSRIAFAAQMNPDLVQGSTSDIYVVSLTTDVVTKVVTQPGPDGGPVWSPDGQWIAFNTKMAKPPYFITNSRVAVVSSSGGAIRSVTDAFDEDPNILAWKADGIWFGGSAKTASHIFRVDPQSSRITRVSSPDEAIFQGGSLNADGSRIAFLSSGPASLAEVSVSPTGGWAPRALTHMTDQAKQFRLGTREVISWKSKDGAEIEGVLIKPANFDASRKYPLLVRIHGGPTGIDRPVLLADRTYYPLDIWVDRGALALEVNYRGSAGYGEKFRMLNMKNLGIGDAWDVLAGVDHLIAKGWVDPARVASMGWSQGGYISAFLTTSTTRFAAISVGAGISDWSTYYYNTDITPFTIEYLGADPVSDPEVYRKTSPITYVKNAKTPTLIQHGDQDRRVPVANAFELRQALENQHVPVEMILYKGFGHPVNKPKAQRAVMSHNLAWFNHYLWGDPLGDLRAPSAPRVLQAGEALAPR